MKLSKSASQYKNILSFIFQNVIEIVTLVQEKRSEKNMKLSESHGMYIGNEALEMNQWKRSME